MMERRKTSFERRELEIVLAARPARTRGLESIRGPPTYEQKKPGYYSEQKNTRGPARSRSCFYRPVLKLPLTFSLFLYRKFFPLLLPQTGEPFVLCEPRPWWNLRCKGTGGETILEIDQQPLLGHH